MLEAQPGLGSTDRDSDDKKTKKSKLQYHGNARGNASQSSSRKKGAPRANVSYRMSSEFKQRIVGDCGGTGGKAG